MKIKANKIFNPEGNDNLDVRTIIKGNTTGLFNLDKSKYSWAKAMYTTMMGNFWIPEKVGGLTNDAEQFKSQLSSAEQKAYKGILSFLIFLDSVQTNNLPNFSDFITSPEVNLLLSIQSYQEAIHSQSYTTILETVVPVNQRDEIFYFWRDDKVLLDRITYIGNIYQEFIDNPTDKNLFKGIVANFLLEGIYFYNGFNFFDVLASKSKMIATSKMINYIRRDEQTHVVIFANIIRAIEKEFPEIYSEEVIKEMMDTAVKQEIKWSKHILNNEIAEVTDENISAYTKWLANRRLNTIGLAPLYPGTNVNPFQHLENMQDSSEDRSNFFETTVTNYSQAAAVGSWDF